MKPFYPSVFKYDLKVAGTETRPFLSILFSKLDKNIFFKKPINIYIFQYTLHYGIIWDGMGFNLNSQYNSFLIISTKREHFIRKNCQIIYKPGSVIEDVISLGLSSHSSSSG